MLCAVTSKDEIILADPFEENFKIFDSEGKFVKSLGGGGLSPENDDFSRFIINPYCFATHDDKIYILDMVLQRVGVFDMNGKLLYAFHVLRIFANAIVVTIGGNIVVGNSIGRCLTYHEYGTLMKDENPSGEMSYHPCGLSKQCLLTIHDKTNNHLIPLIMKGTGRENTTYVRINGNWVQFTNNIGIFEVEQILVKRNFAYWLCGGELVAHCVDEREDSFIYGRRLGSFGTVSSGFYLHAPTSFAVSSTDKIVVCDQGRVQMFKFNQYQPELVGVLRWQPKAKSLNPPISSPSILSTTGTTTGTIPEPANKMPLEENTNPPKSLKVLIHVFLKFMSRILINNEPFECCEVVYDRNQCTVYGENSRILKILDKISRIEFNTGGTSITKIVASGVDIEFTAHVDKLHVTDECVVLVRGGVNQIDVYSGLISCDGHVGVARSLDGNITNLTTNKHHPRESKSYEYPFRFNSPVNCVQLSSCNIQCNTNLNLITGSDSILKITGDVSTVGTTYGKICASRVSIAKTIHGDIVLNEAEQAQSTGGSVIIGGKNKKE